MCHRLVAQIECQRNNGDMSTQKYIYEALQSFAAEVTAKSGGTSGGSPEDQLRGPFENLMKVVGGATDREIVCVGETSLPDRQGRPDFGILEKGLLTGYAELKAPGKGVQSSRFTGHDLQQFKRFSQLPNILYTDGNDWAVYRNGKAEGRRVRLNGDVSQDGKDAVEKRDADALLKLLTRFVNWKPDIPKRAQGTINLPEFAKRLATLCKFLRDDVEEALSENSSQLRHVAEGWRKLLFPNANDKQFADAYAQTVTFALLLARSEGTRDDTEGLTFDSAADKLKEGHTLMSVALQALTDSEIRKELDAGLQTILRLIGALNPKDLSGSADPWIQFYEEFLTVYDPVLRKDAGVYYTPVEVVGAQVRLIDSLLVERLGKQQGFADEGVTTIDPATGTGTYLLAIIEHSIGRIVAKQGEPAAAANAVQLGRNLLGFELMVGPFAVTEMRVANTLRRHGAALINAQRIFLTNTLESPERQPPQGTFYVERVLAEQASKALNVKKDVNVLVCIGNPPYDRADAAAESGDWVRYGDEGWIRNEKGKPVRKPILEDFLKPARDAKHGGDLKNLYNLYIYFWRWALWKVFEQNGADEPGIVSFITASSYIRGDAFAGMRQHLRELCDQIWILDLGGEGRGPRKSENIFNIQTPVAIAIAFRASKKMHKQPAKVRFARIEGSREEKLETLDKIASFDHVSWQDCPDDKQAPFTPAGVGTYFAWPLLTDLMPWQHSGVQLKRTWPISPAGDTLALRWKGLLLADDRANAMRETEDRQAVKSYKVDLLGFSDALPIREIAAGTPTPPIRRYAYRFLDIQELIGDGRLISRPRPPLWGCYSDKQIYFSGLFSEPLGAGPALAVSAEIPDLHYFRGRGGKDVVPLYRDADAIQPNILPGLLARLGASYGHEVTPEDFSAYIYGIMGHPAYTGRYYEELDTREVRVPLTKNGALFESVRKVGARLLWRHTYGQRFVPAEHLRGRTPNGEAQNTVAVPLCEDGFPRSFEYDAPTRTLHVGKGQFAPVSSEVYEFEVSGLKVVQSWLRYRMKDGAGKKSSPLDDIRPTIWSAAFTTELLELIWVLEATVAGYPEQAELLEAVVTGDCFIAGEMPDVPPGMRKPPRVPSAGSRLV